MAQKEVVDLLKELFQELKKEYPTGFIGLSVREICNKLEDKANSKTISKTMKKLQKFGEVEYIEISVEKARKIYGNNINKPLKIFFVVEN